MVYGILLPHPKCLFHAWMHHGKPCWHVRSQNHHVVWSAAKLGEIFFVTFGNSLLSLVWLKPLGVSICFWSFSHVFVGCFVDFSLIQLYPALQFQTSADLPTWPYLKPWWQGQDRRPIGPFEAGCFCLWYSVSLRTGNHYLVDIMN